MTKWDVPPQDIEVTKDVKVCGVGDDERLSLLKCVCGRQTYRYDHTISVYREWASECPKCGRKLYFRNSIVYQVVEP